MPLCGVHSSGSSTVACTISRFLKLPLRFRQYRQHACLAAYPCFLPTAFSSAVTRSRTFSSSHSVLRSSFSAKPCEPHAALRFFSFGNTIASGLFAFGSACCEIFQPHVTVLAEYSHQADFLHQITGAVCRLQAFESWASQSQIGFYIR